MRQNGKGDSEGKNRNKGRVLPANTVTDADIYQRTLSADIGAV